MRFEVDVYFESDKTTPLADALLSLRAIDVEAPTQEKAELYGALIVKALQQSVDEWWRR